PRLAPAIGKATMSRLQNKVVGTPMTQRERNAWNAAKDKGLSECPGRRANPTERRTEHDLHGPQIHWRGLLRRDRERRQRSSGRAEGKGRGHRLSLHGPSVANTDEEIRMIDDLVAQKPDAIIIAANHADA